MQLVQFPAVSPTTGAALPYAQIIAYAAGTSALASAYDANGNPLVQPFSADNNGIVSFYSPGGEIDIRVLSAAAATKYGPGASLFMVDTTLSAGMDVDAGRTITVNNCTLYIGGFFRAPPVQVFTLIGTGKVVFLPGACATAYVEWWDGSARAACRSAILAALASGAAFVQLLKASYTLGGSGPLKIANAPSVSNIWLFGTGSNWAGEGSCARLVVSGGSANCLEIGLDAFPGSYSVLPSHIHVLNLCLMRDAEPVPAAAGSEYQSPSGCFVKYSIFVYLQNVKADEHSNGFLYKGSVQCHTRDCYASRAAVGTGSGNDEFRGYYAYGQADDIGAAGGNASIYFEGTNGASCSTRSVRSTGLYADGAFADLFIDRLEIAGCDRWMHLIGTYATDSNNSSATPSVANSQKASNGDVRVSACAGDTFKDFGILLEQTSRYATITIDHWYGAPGVPGSEQAAVCLSGGSGTVNVSDGKAVDWPIPNCIGIYASNFGGTLTTARNQLKGSARPAVIQGCTGGFIDMQDIYDTPLETPEEAAVYVAASNNIYLAPTIPAGAHVFPQAVNIADSTSANITVDTAKIGVGAATDLVWINGVARNSAATYGTIKVR